VTSLLKRAVVLSFARFSNQAIVLLSPVLLVRILSVGEYGSYREFMVYASLVGPLVSFGIARSLPFLIPKYPEQERTWVTQTVLYVAASSCVAIIAIFFAGDLIRAKTSFDFVTALQLYLIFFTNFDFIELYWLGKKRTDYVLYYSTGRLLALTTVVVAAALLTRDALSIVYGLVALEAIRCLLVFWYSNSRRWFTSRLSRASLTLQASYFLPLGSGAVVQTVNSNAGMLFVSTMIGAEALAFYAIGTFAMKIIDILRGAIADVIFPDIVEVKSAAPKDALPLWRRATVWYCVMLFPVAILFLFYADVVVTVLFTAKYSAAIPIFSEFAFSLILSCFDFHLPLRVQNANRYFLIGNIIKLFANLSLLYPMYLLFGLLGPAISLILSRLIFVVYLAHRTLYVYEIHIGELVLWRDVSKVLAAAVLCAPVLIIGKLLVGQLLLRGILFGGAYLLMYLLLLRLLRVWDAFAMAGALLRSKKRKVLD